MKDEELATLARTIVDELRRSVPPVVAGWSLPTRDILAQGSCCEGHCPCDSYCACHGNAGCSCDSRCGCQGHTSRGGDDLVRIADLATLPSGELKSVLDVAPILRKLRYPDRKSLEMVGKKS